jgi:hypothetical protein
VLYVPLPFRSISKWIQGYNLLKLMAVKRRNLKERASTLLLDNGTNPLPLQQVTLTAALICLHHLASNQGNKYSLVLLHVLLRFDKKNLRLS